DRTRGFALDRWGGRGLLNRSKRRLASPGQRRPLNTAGAIVKKGPIGLVGTPSTASHYKAEINPCPLACSRPFSIEHREVAIELVGTPSTASHYEAEINPCPLACSRSLSIEHRAVAIELVGTPSTASHYVEVNPCPLACSQPLSIEHRAVAIYH